MPVTDIDKVRAPWSDRRIEIAIFLAFLAVRLAYAIAIHGTGFAASLDCDNARYDEQSSGILQGDYDLETPLFITAPFYPFFQALFKAVFHDHWLPAISTVQLILCCLSGVVLFRIARLLFDQRVALTAAAVYAVFPATFLWVVNPAQEMLFQIFLIFSIHALLLAVQRRTVRSTLLAAALFSLTFLTKSHILLFAPFIAVFWWMNMQAPMRRKAGLLGLYVAVCVAFTLPFGLYNLKQHDIYVISSTGQGGHFLTGHNDDVYIYIVDPPPLGSPEHRRIHHMDYTVLRELQDTLALLPHKAQQALYLKKGLEWCREHPRQLAILTLYDLYFFLLPGVNYNHYTFAKWALMFVLSLPLYAFAYTGVFIALRARFRKHSWMLWLVVSLILFSCAFFVQNRFRTITLEPFYIIYASFALLRLLRWKWGDRWSWLQAPVVA